MCFFSLTKIALFFYLCFSLFTKLQTMKRITLSLLCILFSFLQLGAQERHFTVSGHITDEESGETLIAAAVIAEDFPKVGVVSNNFGYYSLTIPSDILSQAPDGILRLQYTFVGYGIQTVEISEASDRIINVRLKTSAELTEAVVSARKEAGMQSNYLGSIEVPLKNIKNAAMLFGENDILKAIQLLPGVQGGNEGFTGLYVRGGGPDENLILLDGLPIYNVDHMLGLFSIFQPEAVKKVSLYKGSFPARYGGRVSSILDIRTNDGNMKETHGSFGVGMLCDKFHIEGPVIKDTLSYSFSARGLHTAIYEPVLRALLTDYYANYFFYDLTGKLTWRISDRDRLYLGGYMGADKLGAKFNEESDNTGDSYYHYRTDAGISWGNRVLSLRWNHIFNKQLFANTTVAYNQYVSTLGSCMEMKDTSDGIKVEQDIDINYISGIRDFSAKMDFDYTANPRHIIKFGAGYTMHIYKPETLSAVANEINAGIIQLDTTLYYTTKKAYPGHELNLYAEDDFNITDNISVNPGIHLALFNTEGKTYFEPQPRVNFRWVAGDFNVKAGYSRMAQYVHLLSSSSVSLPTDLWVPITKNIKPVTSDQISLGTYYGGLSGWEFSIEGYYKAMHNILEYKDGMVALGSSSWENNVEMGEGRAYGVEFFVEKKTGKATGWLAYTLAKSDRHFPDGSINLGRPFPYKYDRRHNLNINVNYEFNEAVNLNLTWSYASGATTTLPTRRSVVIDPYGNLKTFDYADSRNNFRLPASHKLNISVNLAHTSRKGNRVEWNFGVYNAYNQMNPNIVMLDFDSNDIDSGNIRLVKYTILPLLPFINYNYKF